MIPNWKDSAVSCNLVFVASCERNDHCAYQFSARRSLKGGFQGGRWKSGQWPSPMGAFGSFTVKSIRGRGHRDVIHKEKGQKEDHRWKYSSSARHMPRDLSGRMGLMEAGKDTAGRKPKEWEQKKKESVLILVRAFFKKVSPETETCQS